MGSNSDVAFHLEVEFSDDVAYLVYLSVIHNIDLHGLIYLYDKLGKDVFFVFFLFAGKDVKFPKANKLERVADMSREMRENVIEGLTFTSGVVQERDAFLKMESLYDGKGNLLIPVKK